MRVLDRLMSRPTELTYEEKVRGAISKGKIPKYIERQQHGGGEGDGEDEGEGDGDGDNPVGTARQPSRAGAQPPTLDDFMEAT